MRPTNIIMQFKRLSKISIGKNGPCGAQMFQFIEGPLAPAVPGDGHPLLAYIFARHLFMQGLGYLHELGDKLVIVPHEAKNVLDLSDGGGGGPFLIASIFPSLATIPWAEMMCPRYVICLWNSSHLESLSYNLGFPVSGTWPPVSRSCWLGLLER